MFYEDDFIKISYKTKITHFGLNVYLNQNEFLSINDYLEILKTIKNYKKNTLYKCENTDYKWLRQIIYFNEMVFLKSQIVKLKKKSLIYYTRLEITYQETLKIKEKWGNSYMYNLKYYKSISLSKAIKISELLDRHIIDIFRKDDLYE